MTRSYDFVQVDVFTTTPFAGNPLAVFPSAQGLSSDEMQSIAREMNLSETTFVLPPSRKGADYRVRIFTTAQELPYAGHPSIGTAWLLASMRRIEARPPSTRFHQDVKAGVLPIDVQCDSAGRVMLVYTTQATPSFGRPVTDRARIAKALGLKLADLHPRLPAQKVSTGLPWLLVPLRDSKALDRVHPNATFFEGRGALYENIYPFTLAHDQAGATTESRGFPMKEFEDPVTGSASGCLGAYLAHHKVVTAHNGVAEFVNAQGRHLRRPGRATVQVEVDARGAPTLVRVGGPAVEVLRGTVTLP